MSDLTLVLDRKDLVVRLDSKKVIRIDRPEAMPQKVPVGQVVVIGRPMVSCDVWRALAEHHVPTVMLPARGRGAAAYMGSFFSGSIENRLGQYRVAHDDEAAMRVCRHLVSMKLEGQIQILRHMNAKQADSGGVKGIQNALRDVQSADTRNRIMGHEGSAATMYFQALAKVLPKEWRFSGRNRRPPKDPVNALLSLSYTIAGSHVRCVIRKRGLDPALGILHVSELGRESFVLDVLEPLRPDVDQLIDGSIGTDDFVKNRPDGCLLNKKGRRVFYESWAGWQEAETNLKSKAKNILKELVDFFTGTGYLKDA